MNGITISEAATWSIAAFATTGIILRPWGLPEAIWAVVGAAALVLLTLLPLQDALVAVAKGTDVYLFLTGMMVLAEVARREGLFNWLAEHAAVAAQGSPRRLFGLVYLVGIVVTAFLSNDATAVVLTPAVYAAAKAAKAKPAALSCRLRAHRKRRKLCASDLKSRQSRSLRQSHAALVALAEAVCLAVGAVNCGNLRCPEHPLSPRPQRRDRRKSRRFRSF